MAGLRRKRDKRKYPRIEAKVKVSFQSVEDLATEFTKNISKGGIFLKTDKPLDPNAEIELTMSFPGGSGEQVVRGRVVRLMSTSHPTDIEKQLYGVGIQFLEPDTEFLEAIGRLIQTSSA